MFGKLIFDALKYCHANISAFLYIEIQGYLFGNLRRSYSNALTSYGYGYDRSYENPYNYDNDRGYGK